MIITSRMIEFGSQDIGNIEGPLTVGKGFGFRATGNGDTIPENIKNASEKESRLRSDLKRLSIDQHFPTSRIAKRALFSDGVNIGLT